MQYITINAPFINNCYLNIIYNSTTADIEKYLNDNYNVEFRKDKRAMDGGYFNFDYKGIIYHQIQLCKLDLGTLVHELFHFISEIMRSRMNTKLTKNTEEFYAFFLDYYFTESIKKLKKVGINLSK